MRILTVLIVTVDSAFRTLARPDAARVGGRYHQRVSAERSDAVPAASPLGLTPLPRLHLDELLHEMLDRVGEVVDSRERLRALLDAVVGIGTDLDLRPTLERIVAAACRLVARPTVRSA